MKRHCFVLLLTLVSFTAAARIEIHTFDTPQQEALYKQLIDELRCLVCQNQNLADSNAELAQDLRQQTYEMIKTGASRDDVINYMTSRYGDFVLYQPPFKASTAMLWIGPFVILGTGVFGVGRFIRKRAKQKETVLSSADRARAEQLLNPNQTSEEPKQ